MSRRPKSYRLRMWRSGLSLNRVPVRNIVLNQCYRLCVSYTNRLIATMGTEADRYEVPI